MVPTALKGVGTNILDPRNTYVDASGWEIKVADLAKLFIANFVQYTDDKEKESLIIARLQL